LAGAELRKGLGIAPDRVVALMIAQDFARKGWRSDQKHLPATIRASLLVAGKQRRLPMNGSPGATASPIA